jgi:hypothetical protein
LRAQLCSKKDEIELKQQPAGPATSPVVRAIIIITTRSTAQAADGTDENTKQCGVPGLCIFSGETKGMGAIGTCSEPHQA